jgi:hypothetical protein
LRLENRGIFPAPGGGLRVLRVLRVVKRQTPNKFRKTLEFRLGHPADPATFSDSPRGWGPEKQPKSANSPGRSGPKFLKLLTVGGYDSPNPSFVDDWGVGVARAAEMARNGRNSLKTRRSGYLPEVSRRLARGQISGGSSRFQARFAGFAGIAGTKTPKPQRFWKIFRVYPYRIQRILQAPGPPRVWRLGSGCRQGVSAV